MTHTIATIRTVALSEYGVAEADLKHFKAGANAAWSDRWADEYGAHDLDRAESHYERKHGLDPHGSASRAFSFGWCWSAAQ